MSSTEDIKNHIYISGNVNTGGGDIVGRDKITLIHQYQMAAEIPPPPEPKPLPEQVKLIGRDSELRAFLGNVPPKNLMAITGMPDIGKTALSIALAHQSHLPEKIRKPKPRYMNRSAASKSNWSGSKKFPKKADAKRQLIEPDHPI